MPPAKLAALPLLLAAQLFRQCSSAAPSMRGATKEETSVLNLLESELGAEWRQATEAIVSNTSDIWQTMYKTLPKNEQGSLDAAATQYALNRFFLQRFRWRVRGLAPTGTAWGENTSVLVVEERMSPRVREYFQDRVYKRGMVQQDLAALAATIELLIRDESKQQLRAAYQVLGLDSDSEISLDGARDVVAVYTTCYAAGVNVSSDFMSEDWWRAELAPEAEIHALYKKVNSWIEASRYPNLISYSFPQLQAIIQVAMEAHLQYVHDKWSEMKGRLLTFEGSSSGRVSLADFYRSILEKGWTSFDERKEFMQQLGVLDESDAVQTRVIIPNYLLNPLNCAGPWGYYATCSINECEFLMSDLERVLGSSEAVPSVIAEKVAALGSSTVKAPRTLSSALVRKLEEVAAHHNGTVPIHGRLFFQWMHFVYPLECPYPFPSGTVRPMSETQFQDETGLQPYYSMEEVTGVVQAIVATPLPNLNCDENADECLAMWNPLEELVQHRKVPLVPLRLSSAPGDDEEENEQARAKDSSHFASALRFMALLATLPAFVQATRQMCLAHQLLSGRADGKKLYLP